MIVTFCGHKDIANTSTVRAVVDEALRDLVAEGADYFLLGGYGGFDSLAAHAVHDLKQQHPEIHSTLVIPYLNREYNTELYDDTTYPPLEDVPMKFAISRRNEWMVDQADVVIAYVTHGWGGAATTLDYAKKKGKRIIDVAVDDKDLNEAHRFSNSHKPELEKDHTCGCFYCLEIFDPAEIEEWIIDDNPCDRRGTAICPKCGIDSVIGESSGFPITKPFLAAMHARWFGSD